MTSYPIPGLDLAKFEHNYEILKKLHQYHSLKCPIMIGVSRKSMIYKKLNVSPEGHLMEPHAYIPLPCNKEHIY